MTRIRPNRKVKWLISLGIGVCVLAAALLLSCRSCRFVAGPEGMTYVETFQGASIDLLPDSDLPQGVGYRLVNERERDWIYFGDAYRLCRWSGLWWTEYPPPQSGLSLYAVAPDTVSHRLRADWPSTLPRGRYCLMAGVRAGERGQERYVRTYFDI